ncbi:peptidase E, partial [Patescibacteria group bacterium]|nr:peptidase E [Patescibacteria group bacterium]
MRKLFLTSAGLQKGIRDYFIELLPRKPEETKVCFIPTAADPYEDKSFIQADKDLAEEIGLQIGELDLKNENKESLLFKLSHYDVIYVCGGNTFYLLDWVRKSSFDKVIEELLDKGKVYVGSSAGSLIAGPSIEISGWKNLDKNIINLKDLTGLNLVPFGVFPHYEDKFKPLLEKETKEINYPVYVLSDKQAVLCYH